jgi:hypothetical protein
MKNPRFNVTGRSHSARRLVGRLAVIGLLSTAPALLVPSSAWASGGDDGLSTTILAHTVPGLVPAPLGTENGPVALSAVGDVGAYIRTWNHQPTNGEAVVIEAFEFTNSSAETFFLNTLDSGLKGQAREKGNAAFAVTGIPGASGAEVHTTSSGKPVTEYIVSFEKGNTVFQEVEATSAHELTAADAVAVADRQVAHAPAVLSSGTSWILLPGVPLLAFFLCIVTVAIRRKRRQPAHLSRFSSHSNTSWDLPAVPPTGDLGFGPLLGATDPESIGTERPSTVPVEVGARIPGGSNPE